MNVYSLRPSDDNFNFVGPSVVDVEITEVCISLELSWQRDDPMITFSTLETKYRPPDDGR